MREKEHVLLWTKSRSKRFIRRYIFVCISMSLLVLLCHCWLMNWIN